MGLPDPLVSADTDVRDLDGFMLNVERMLASELWALSSGDEFKAAFALWCRAWKQFPAGSLPDDDRVLAAFSGAGKAWSKIKEMALRGFVKCSDGRLYHKVLCEDVKRAAAKKAERRERTKAATEARKNYRNDQRNVPRDDDPDDNRDGSQNGNVTTSQGQGQGQGQGQEEKKKPAAGVPGRLEFDAREKTMSDAARPMPVATDPDFSPMHTLIANRYSLELDILPAIEKAKREGKDFKSWDSLVGWVETQNKKRKRAQASKPENVTPSPAIPPIDTSAKSLKNLAKIYVNSSYFPRDQMSEPGTPGSPVTAEMVAEARAEQAEIARKRIEATQAEEARERSAWPMN